MPEDVRTDLRDRLEDLYGARLEKLLVFGSRARGDASEDSDLDVLIVLTGGVDRSLERDRLSDLMLDVIEAHDIVVSPIVVSKEEFANADYPLLKSARREGVAL